MFVADIGVAGVSSSARLNSVLLRKIPVVVQLGQRQAAHGPPAGARLFVMQGSPPPSPFPSPRWRDRAEEARKSKPGPYGVGRRVVRVELDR